ncbi:hypothetical protein TNCV_2872131 [Trichonephila clavipes]|nr:hypothetical protein TNCV_2872131 [Trichonephila clavipes]
MSPNLPDKLKVVMVGSMGTTNCHRTTGWKTRVAEESCDTVDVELLQSILTTTQHYVWFKHDGVAAKFFDSDSKRPPGYLSQETYRMRWTYSTMLPGPQPIGLLLLGPP